MEVRFWIVLLTALIPLIVGFIWYNDKVFGKTWFNVSGMTEEKMNSGNMLLIFGLTYFFGLMISMALFSFVIHQFSISGLLAMQEGFGDQTGPHWQYFADFMSKYGDLHRTFGHGAVHGAIAGIFFALPLVAINSLFERKNWKYILIHGGYWIVVLTLIGGVLCAFA